MIRPFYQKHLFRLVLVMAVALVFSSTSPVTAAPITFVAQGTVNHVDLELAGSFTIGDTFRVEYTFESLTPDANPTDPVRGDYEGAITDLSVTVGDYSATAAGGGYIAVINDWSEDVYRIDLPDSIIGPSVNGYDLWKLAPLIMLWDSTCSALASDALPTDPSDLSGFDLSSGTLALRFVALPLNPYAPPPSPEYVMADITSITSIPPAAVIPEPSSLSLLALAGLALLRRRR